MHSLVNRFSAPAPLATPRTSVAAILNANAGDGAQGNPAHDQTPLVNCRCLSGLACSAPGQVGIVNASEPGLYGAANKRDLSTGETRELVPDNVGYGLNPRVERALPRRLLSNWRDRPARENLRNVADTGNGGRRRCRQDSALVSFVRGPYGSPAEIRTPIHGSKGRCPTIRRPGKIWRTPV
jgi:hypothetical protein